MDQTTQPILTADLRQQSVPASRETMAKPARVDAVDALRGLAIVLMTLDHVRDFLGNAKVDATDPRTATLALFLTRYVTHLCAPIFTFLAGVGARLSLAKMERRQVAEFLVKRGLWLMVLELTVIAQAWFLGFGHGLTLAVIWALGVSMIALAGLIFVPDRWLLGLGLVIVCGHNVLDGFSPAGEGTLALLWDVAHRRGPQTFGSLKVYNLYPVLPWIGLMTLGWVAGPLFTHASPRRRGVIAMAGFLMLSLFATMRFLGLYGDEYALAALRDHGDPLMQLMAWLRVQKYPPSLHYLLVTVGMGALLFVGLQQLPAKLRGYLVTFGRVPFFYYIVHLYLLHAVALGILGLRSGTVPWTWNFLTDQDVDLPLATVYGAWLVTVVGLYPLCAWFARLKARYPVWWLRYL